MSGYFVILLVCTNFYGFCVTERDTETIIINDELEKCNMYNTKQADADNRHGVILQLEAGQGITFSLHEEPSDTR